MMDSRLGHQRGDDALTISAGDTTLNTTDTPLVAEFRRLLSQTRNEEGGGLGVGAERGHARSCGFTEKICAH
jgi:hypothetical protein